MKKGKVVRCVGGVFHVYCDGKKWRLFSRKKIRLVEEVLVGDNVEFDEKEKTIEKVLPRSNRLTRPPIANVDCVLVFVAKTPEPDFLLVDKILLNCFIQNVEPMIVLNKSDISDVDFVERIIENYSSVASVTCISAMTGEGVDLLKQDIEGKTVCLAGQSAVGKTTLLNFLAQEKMPTGELSEKISRGKNTTRHSEIFCYGQNSFLVDTPGFSLLDTEGIESYELNLYYPEYTDVAMKCRFNMCTHTAEPDCEVKKLVSNGTLSKERYERYCIIFNQLKQMEENRF